MIDLAELIAECDVRGIRLVPAGDGGLSIDASRAALTPDLLDRLKVHKLDLLATLAPTPDSVLDVPEAVNDVEVEPNVPVCRCGSTTWQDVPIHNGQSVRRDCGHCERFIAFPFWYVKNTGPNGQHSV